MEGHYTGRLLLGKKVHGAATLHDKYLIQGKGEAHNKEIRSMLDYHHCIKICGSRNRKDCCGKVMYNYSVLYEQGTFSRMCL